MYFGTSFAYRGPYEYEPEEVILSRLDAHQGIVAVDTETVNTQDYTCIGIGVYLNDGEGFYFRVFPVQDEQVPKVLGMLCNPEITKIYHNGQSFDLEVLSKLGYEEGFGQPDDVNFQDSELMAKVHGLPGGLQRVGEDWLGATDLFSIKDLFTEYRTTNMLVVPWKRVAEKCLNDCRTTWELYQYMERRLSPAQRDCYEVDRRLIPVLRSIQTRGLRLREGVLKEFERDLSRDVLRIERFCEAEAQFKPSAPSQVGYVLASRGNILPFTKNKKQLKTDEATLEDCPDPLAAVVLEYRKQAKLLSTYVRPWLERDRAYTHFRLDLSTGRLASGRINEWDYVNRNLQNVPVSMRAVFGPDNEIFTWADHGQIELRCLAFLAKDRVMMAEYAKDLTGGKPDLHSATMYAAQRFVPGFTRDNGKTFNFARVFGAGDWKLHKSTGVPIDKVPMVRAAMANLYPESEEYIRHQMYEHNGEWVEDLYGRRMRLPEMVEGADYNVKYFQGHVNKTAVNYPVQGTAANIVKRGMLAIFKTGVDLRLQIHDEYLVDGYWEPEPGLAWINPDLHTPFEVKQAKTWT